MKLNNPAEKSKPRYRSQYSGPRPPKSGEHSIQEMRQFSAGIIIYRRTQDGPRFLLLYHGGRYWSFPKGKIESEEGSYDAAFREVFEETGLSRNDIRVDNGFGAQDRFVFRERNKKIFKTVYYLLGESSEARIKISDEHHGFGWFLYRDCVRMLIYQNLKNNIKNAYDFISRKSVRGREENPKRAGHHISRFSSRNRFSQGGSRGRERAQ